MIHYLDASFAAAAFTSESGTVAAQAWLRSDADRVLAISGWVEAEFASAMSIKTRTGQLGAEDKIDVNAQWREFRDSRLTQVAIMASDFENAARFADRHDLNLRAGDALHIAVAARHGCTLVTLDRVMASAALACGVPLAEIAA